MTRAIPDQFNTVFKEYDTLKNAIDSGERLARLETVETFSGVIVAMRRFGKIAFGKVLSTHGCIQIMLQENPDSEAGMSTKELVKQLTLGSYVKVVGNPALTSTREPTLFVTQIEVVQTATNSFPDKFNGVSEQEKRRLRYQETLVNQDAHNLIRNRSKFMRVIRDYLDGKGFLEVETPILHNAACGANARAFTTHVRATDSNHVLRIAPETYLKRMTAGGFHKIYEIGKQFRNEGVDPTHMPEFTSCEWYEAFTDYKDQIPNFLNMVSVIEDAFGKKILPERMEVRSWASLMAEYVNPTVVDPTLSLDEVFNKYVRPNLQEPIIVADYPAVVAPLAKRSSYEPGFVEMWQFIWKGQEIAKCYTELVDPVAQREALERQRGEHEAMELDEGFLQTMEFGMPPQAGLGFGVDRLFALMMEVDDIRDSVFFPLGV